MREAWEKILRLDRSVEHWKEFYRRVQLFYGNAPLEKWAKEDIKELLDTFREVK